MKAINKVRKQPNRISRYINREILELKSTKIFKSNRSAYLISDSKGKDLQFLKEKKYLKFLYKGGAEITNSVIQQYARYQVTRSQNKYPVILFWIKNHVIRNKKKSYLSSIIERKLCFWNVHTTHCRCTMSLGAKI